MKIPSILQLFKASTLLLFTVVAISVVSVFDPESRHVYMICASVFASAAGICITMEQITAIIWKNIRNKTFL